jgi:hypothetical protein
MHRRIRVRSIIGFSVLAMTLVVASAGATVIHKTVPISSSQEVPPSGTGATGTGQIVIDTDANTLSYNISYSGLSSTETAAHIHGFAARGVNVGVLHGLPATNPKIGTWTYTDAQEANILAGLIYINIHTTNFPGGEMRGQIDQAGTLPGSSPVGIIVLASALLGGGALFMLMRRRRSIA